MIANNWFYSATDIARPLVNGDIPASGQYAFLKLLHETETPFLPSSWRNGKPGLRTMLLDVQSAMAYLADQDSFDAERPMVEDEGGSLPDSTLLIGAQPFLKALRIDMALKDSLGFANATLRRMKCRAILRKCGLRRRNEVFLQQFQMASAFYHILLRGSWCESFTFSIEEFSLDDTIVLTRA